MKKVYAWTDGSALGNPGPGGYGSIMRFVDSRGDVHESELSRGYAKTTNNRMEIMGVIAVFEALKEDVDITITTDSQYVVKAFNEHWIDGWIKKKWKRSGGKPVINIDLWKRLVELTKNHKTTFVWVRGHDGHPENERCDVLAKNAASSDDLEIDAGYMCSDDQPALF